jgi:small subunit ribosomal protein S29
MGQHVREGKKMKLGKFKKNRSERGRPPQPGERKALRKRITLSNDNALAVPDLESLTAENMLSLESAGKVLKIPGEICDQLRAVDAFKPTQTWGIFRTPSTLLRTESVELMNQIHKAAAAKQTLKLVISGDKIAGKSTLLLQALTNAYLNNWIVFNLPDGQLRFLSYTGTCSC